MNLFLLRFTERPMTLIFPEDHLHVQVEHFQLQTSVSTCTVGWAQAAVLIRLEVCGFSFRSSFEPTGFLSLSSGFKTLRTESSRWNVLKKDLKSEVTLTAMNRVSSRFTVLKVTPPVSTDVSVSLNQAVRLQCEKPSSLAVLSWTSPQRKFLPETLFIRSPDGGLSFLASAQTLGTYSCEAEEAGHREVVVSYRVLETFTPRSIVPQPGEDFEDISTETAVPEDSVNTPDPPVLETPSAEDPGKPAATTKAGPDVPTKPAYKTSSSTSRTENQISMDVPRREKSFYGELVVVSLLLAASVCVMAVGAFVVWRQKKTGLHSDHLLMGEDSSKTHTIMEICSLESTKEAASELKNGE
ncbi:hypothetical protein FQA47_012500 [Oryzias melastigma]|uniref:Ig-like domain-containing protein n=1 Tax=Oryzias melastigma TaxID=30732 RepID=A0A834L0T1_ORYME|nr:hypothetical protein FQA47_012500 [Oryzias melastigma]